MTVDSIGVKDNKITCTDIYFIKFTRKTSCIIKARITPWYK